MLSKYHTLIETEPNYHDNSPEFNLYMKISKNYLPRLWKDYYQYLKLKEKCEKNIDDYLNYVKDQTLKDYSYDKIIKILDNRKKDLQVNADEWIFQTQIQMEINQFQIWKKSCNSILYSVTNIEEYINEQEDKLNGIILALHIVNLPFGLNFLLGKILGPPCNQFKNV